MVLLVIIWAPWVRGNNASVSKLYLTLESSDKGFVHGIAAVVFTLAVV